MHRFILKPEALRPGRVLLDKKESHHARNVLRVKPGEVVELLDGEGARYRAVIAGFDGEHVELSVDRTPERAPVRPETTLAGAVVRPERMEWMLEKACELGVHGWAPVLTERAVVKLSRERWQAKVARWKKIAQESCKQCGLPRVPDVAEPVPFKQMVGRIADFGLAVLPTLAVPTRSLGEAFSSRPEAGSLLILTGPEGDFTPKEVSQAVEAGAVPVSLGSLVLRAETAAIYVLSAARFFYGSLGDIRGNKK